MIEIHLDRKRFLEGFLLTKTPILKLTKNNQDSSVYVMYLATVHSISWAASKSLDWLE